MKDSQRKAMWARKLQSTSHNLGLKEYHSPYPYNEDGSVNKHFRKNFDKVGNIHEKKLTVLNKQHFDDKFYLYEVRPEERKDHMGYQFLVSHGAMSHTAFRSKEALDDWLRETGLKLTGSMNPINQQGMGNPQEKVFKIKGQYNRISLSGSGEQLKEFAKKHDLKQIEVLENGHYQHGYVHESPNGNTIYHMNVNYPHETLPYKHK